MARGNDGNLLQHATEVALFAALMDSAAVRTLHVALTHGMESVEPLDVPTTPEREKSGALLRSKLLLSRTAGRESPLVLRAYAASGASASGYPNSAKLLTDTAPLLSAQVGGVICEAAPGKAKQLMASLGGKALAVHSGSWRCAAPKLVAPASLAGPWLFSMDPMKFVKAKPADNDMMTEDDWQRLMPLWRSYLDAGSAGAIAVFSYSMSRPEREWFFRSICRDLLPHLPELRLGVLQALNHTSDYHCAALLSRDESLLRGVRDAVVPLFGRRGRDRDGEYSIPCNVFEQ